RTRYHSGIRCGQPRGPCVAQVTTRCSSRKAEISSADMTICARRLLTRDPGRKFDRRRSLSAGAGARADRLRGDADGLASVLGLEHHGVTGLLEDLTCQPVNA